jgi:hypothetical protein
VEIDARDNREERLSFTCSSFIHYFLVQSCARFYLLSRASFSSLFFPLGNRITRGKKLSPLNDEERGGSARELENYLPSDTINFCLLLRRGQKEKKFCSFS